MIRSATYLECLGVSLCQYGHTSWGDFQLCGSVVTFCLSVCQTVGMPGCKSVPVWNAPVGMDFGAKEVTGTQCDKRLTCLSA